MNRSIEQAIFALIPTYSGNLPPELINHATSLLAQSRSRASSLKAEEEVARGYACAHIACERLKQSLNLPKIEPRPPCPPRVYKKVYMYLDSALPGTPTTRGRVRDIDSAKERARPSLKSGQRSATTQPVSSTPRRRLRFEDFYKEKEGPSPSDCGKTNGGKSTRPKEGDGDGVPEWVMPTIRTLCAALKTPQAVVHTFAGVCSVVKHETRLEDSQNGPVKKRRKAKPAASGTRVDFVGEGARDINLLGLVATLCLYCVARMADTEVTPQQYTEQTQTALDCLLGTEQGKHYARDELLELVERFIRLGHDDWMKMDWYLNIPQKDNELEANGDFDGTEKVDKPASRNKGIVSQKSLSIESPSGLHISLGSMMHKKVDFLSEERQLQYEDWRAEVRARILEMDTESKA